MIRSSLLGLFLVFVICSFCGKNFESIGRHQWRCKEKINYVEEISDTSAVIGSMPVINSSPSNSARRSGIKCCCGKICKGARGLKMHQRSCRVIHGLNSELRSDLDENNEDTNLDVHCNTSENEIDEFPSLKKGINLPKSEGEWLTANEHFKLSLNLNHPITSHDIFLSITALNDLIYNYFASNFGYVEGPPDDALVKKYENHTARELKKALKLLKSTNSNVTEIKYVARLLRNSLRTNNTNKSASTLDNSFNHDDYIHRNFWGYVKNVLKTKRELLPTFSMSECLSYFAKVLSKINPNKIFQIPSWIPMLPEPTVEFNLDPPTYQQVTNVIRNMKTSGSPCPLDQLSIICFK